MQFRFKFSFLGVVTAIAFLVAPVSQASESQERLLVASRSAHQIVVLDAVSLTVLSRHDTGFGPHELAVTGDGTAAYAANYGTFPAPHAQPIPSSALRWLEEDDGSVSRLALNGSATAEKFNLPGCGVSHGISVSPDGRWLWRTCDEKGLVQEIDLRSRQLVRQWQTGGTRPHIVKPTPDMGYLIVSHTGSGSIAIIERDSGQVRVVETGSGAEGLEVSDDGRSVWVGNTGANTISLVDIRQGGEISEFPSGGRFPVKLGLARGGREVWVANVFSRSLTIIDTATYDVIETIELESTPLGLIVAPNGDRIFVTLPRLNQVVAYDVESRSRIAVNEEVMEGDGMAFIRLAD